MIGCVFPAGSGILARVSAALFCFTNRPSSGKHQGRTEGGKLRPGGRLWFDDVLNQARRASISPPKAECRVLSAGSVRKRFGRPHLRSSSQQLSTAQSPVHPAPCAVTRDSAGMSRSWRFVHVRHGTLCMTSSVPSTKKNLHQPLVNTINYLPS